MKLEKPAPGGASSSGKSIESRQPETASTDAKHQAVSFGQQCEGCGEAFVDHADFDDDYINVDPYAGDPPSRRKDRNLARNLNRLDPLHKGTGSKKMIASPFPEPPTDGIHSWVMNSAWWCRKSGMNVGEAIKLIQGHDGTLRRRLQPREAADAIEKVYSTRLDRSVKLERAQELPPWNLMETQRIFDKTGATVDILLDLSPEPNPASIHPGGILGRLFPEPGGLLCIGDSAFDFLTAPLRDHHQLHLKQFITPAYMTSVYGETQNGKRSMHCKANTGPRRFIVCDFDSPPSEQHAAIILHLSKFRPLIMVLTSGGKSLHAWFQTTTSSQDDRLFWRLCIALGADPALYRNHSQFVRLPNGTRNNGKRQSVVYFNPAA